MRLFWHCAAQPAKSLKTGPRRMRARVAALHRHTGINRNRPEQNPGKNCRPDSEKEASIKAGCADLGRREDCDRLLGSVAVEDVWGIGRRYADMLRQSGITTARDLKYADDGWVRRRMTIQGLRTVMELRGIDCLALDDSARIRPGSILSSRSFGTPVEDCSAAARSTC